MDHAEIAEGVGHLPRTVLSLVLAVLLSGLVLGWATGLALTSAFEAIQVDQIGQQLGSGSEDPVRADTLRP